MSPQTMKAVRVHAPAPIESAPLRLEEIACPRPGPGEILIQIEACGICHTDLHLVEGEIPLRRAPLIPGHQIVGIAVETGARVGIAWLRGACGECDHCRRGLENLCAAARFTGYDEDGGYAEYTVAPAAFVYPIPAGIDAGIAAPLLCAGVIGYRALRLAGAEAGMRLALFGFGASAHLSLQVARARGCEVDVYTRSVRHRQVALALGASRAASAAEAPAESADGAILFAPAGDLVPRALRTLRRGATLSVASIYLDRIPQMSYGDLLYGERVLRSVTAATRRDASDLLREAVSIPLRPQVEEFPLAAANEALLALKQSRLGAAGVLRVSAGARAASTLPAPAVPRDRAG
jgi:propanol-preferring alcohol dehydrogenase